MNSNLNRREFLLTLLGLGSSALVASVLEACSSPLSNPSPLHNPTGMATRASPTPFQAESPTPSPQPSPTKASSATPTSPKAHISLVRTQDRAAGLRRAIDLFPEDRTLGKNLFLKPNLNSAHPAPGSTDNRTLQALVQKLYQMGADHITVGDRSGMADTKAVMRQKDLFRMGEELGFEVMALDDLDENGWEMVQKPGDHWASGFAFARPALSADSIIQTCCLKTHRFGGHFTLSLKNSVGLVARRVPGDRNNYMQELHNSPHQRKMIAEINAAYEPDLVILDGVEAFVDGGPDQGKRVNAGVVLAGADRVALDAVGVAILRHFGTTSAVRKGPIFGLDQIARAVELGLGVSGPEQIELITDDPESRAFADQIRPLLAAS